MHEPLPHEFKDKFKDGESERSHVNAGWMDALQTLQRASHVPGMKQVQTRTGREHVVRMSKTGVEGR